MTIQAQEQRHYTLKEYLDLEVASEERHEYIDGQVILMTGGLPDHNQIAGNPSVPCQILLADLYDKVEFTAEE